MTTLPPNPWRSPDEESDDLYPGLVVHDGRVSGSVVIGRSRLALWAIIWEAITCGWDSVQADYEPPAGFDAEALATFLYNLLEARGEFGRLLLVLANAERLERAADEATLTAAAPDGGLVNITPGDDDAVDLTAWWQIPSMRSPVVAQLEHCLAALGNPSLVSLADDLETQAVDLSTGSALDAERAAGIRRSVDAIRRLATGDRTA